MKVICVGLPKTGTKSMRVALEVLEFQNVHDVMEQIKYDEHILKKALGMVEKKATTEDFKRCYKDVDALTDFPGVFIWKELLKAFPDAKVVLMERDSVEQWLGSVKNMMEVEMREVVYFKFYKLVKLLLVNRLCPTIKTFMEFRRDCWLRLVNADEVWNNVSFEHARELYNNYNEQVKKLCPKDKLLVFNVKEGWEPLCKFLGKETPTIPFPKHNIRHSISRDVMNDKADYHHDAGMNAQIFRELSRALFLYATVFVCFIGMGYYALTGT